MAFLSNDMRSLLGLELISENWDKIYIDTMTLFFENDILRKIINEVESSYLERDVDIVTINRELIPSKTKKGKDKVISTKTLIGGLHDVYTVSFDKYLDESFILCYNNYNKQKMKIPLSSKHNTIEDVNKSYEDIMKDAPQDLKKKIDIIKLEKKRRVNYKNGDIVKVDIDWKEHAYVTILGRFSEYRKKGLIPKGHPYDNIMTVPVIVRPFDKIFTQDISLEQLLTYDYQDSIITMDDTILSNTHSVVYHKQLEISDLDFPQHCL